MFSRRNEPSSFERTVRGKCKANYPVRACLQSIRNKVLITFTSNLQQHCHSTLINIFLFWLRGWSLPVWLPLIWLLRDTEASGTPSPPTLLRTRPVTEKPMTRKMGYRWSNGKRILYQGEVICAKVHRIGWTKWEILKNVHWKIELWCTALPLASNCCAPPWNSS